MSDQPDLQDDRPPRRIWLQWDGDSDGGDLYDGPRGEVTWCAERVYPRDVCYVRAGRHTSEAMRDLDEEIAALRARVGGMGKRVAELEEVLRWRLGTEPPPGPGLYEVKDDFGLDHRAFTGEYWIDGTEEVVPDWWRPIYPTPDNDADEGRR